MKAIRLVVIGRSNDANAYNLANDVTAVQREFDFSVQKEIMGLPKGVSTTCVHLETLEMLGKKLIADKYPGEYPDVLCDCGLEGDLFSSYDGDVAVITTYGWTRKFSPYPVQRYIAYILADVLLSYHVDTQSHSKSKGCVGDYCDDKKDINRGLAKCAYCADCHALILKDVAKGSITLSQLAAIYRILDFAAGRRFCFVLMPFAKEFDPVYKKAINPTLTQKKCLCKRADKIFQPREIMTLIWEQILRADLIVADLTGRNPNVFYELGYAHALHKNTILITQSIDDVPFDLRHRQIIEYTASPRGFENLNRSLKQYV